MTVVEYFKKWYAWTWINDMSEEIGLVPNIVCADGTIFPNIDFPDFDHFHANIDFDPESSSYAECPNDLDKVTISMFEVTPTCSKFMSFKELEDLVAQHGGCIEDTTVIVDYAMDVPDEYLESVAVDNLKKMIRTFVITSIENGTFSIN